MKFFIVQNREDLNVVLLYQAFDVESVYVDLSEEYIGDIDETESAKERIISEWSVEEYQAIKVKRNKFPPEMEEGIIAE